MKIDNIHCHHISVSADKLKSLAKEHWDTVDRDRIEPANSRPRRDTGVMFPFNSLFSVDQTSALKQQRSFSGSCQERTTQRRRTTGLQGPTHWQRSTLPRRRSEWRRRSGEFRLRERRVFPVWQHFSAEANWSGKAGHASERCPHTHIHIAVEYFLTRLRQQTRLWISAPPWRCDVH